MTEPAYDVPWDAVRCMGIAYIVTLVVLFLPMLAAWYGWWPFNKQDK